MKSFKFATVETMVAADYVGIASSVFHLFSDKNLVPTAMLLPK